MLARVRSIYFVVTRPNELSAPALLLLLPVKRPPYERDFRISVYLHMTVAVRRNLVSFVDVEISALPLASLARQAQSHFKVAF